MGGGETHLIKTASQQIHQGYRAGLQCSEGLENEVSLGFQQQQGSHCLAEQEVIHHGLLLLRGLGTVHTPISSHLHKEKNCWWGPSILQSGTHV